MGAYPDKGIVGRLESGGEREEAREGNAKGKKRREREMVKKGKERAKTKEERNGRI